jgi:hypothetical protein
VPPTADPENVDHRKKDELEKPEEKSSFLHVGLPFPVFMDYLFQRAERLKERNGGAAPIISGEGKSCLGIGGSNS